VAIILSLESPVIAVSDWMPVTKLSDGSERGQIRVTLAAGSDKQVKRLLLNQTSSEEEEPSSEHLYDSVWESTTTSSSVSFQKESFVPAGRNGPKEQQQQPRKAREIVSKGHHHHVDSQRRHHEGKKLREDASVTKPPAAAEAKKYFRADVTVEEARNLPKVFNQLKSEKTPPSAFVTFSSHGKSTAVVSTVAAGSSNPR
jgi:hypothetical protein